MPSRCALGGDAGLLLDRPRGPVLSEYTRNVIRKINTEIDLMCPFVVCLVLVSRLKIAADAVYGPVIIGFCRDSKRGSSTPAKALIK
jgi:hypothetical protein